VFAAFSLVLEWFGAALAPPCCAACDEPVALLSAFCFACASTAQRAVPPHPLEVAGFVYGGAVARAIGRMKYERRPDLARPLADLLWRAIEPCQAELGGFAVVPVPLHPSRLAERGFNQSALVARPIARRLGAPFWARVLLRARDTGRQANLDRKGRDANVARAFVVPNPERVRGRNILLIDDVRTTGATLDACAAALFTAGAARVGWAVVAHVPAAQEGSQAPFRPQEYNLPQP
jgi:ComF family protein